MKKYTSYILIIIALVGLLGPGVGLFASQVNPNEICTYDVSNSTTPNNEPCKVPGPNDTKTSNYQLLAPLPCPDGVSGCVNGKFTTFDSASDASGKNTRLGEYLNLMIKIFIGLCAVLAVVMIVVGGMQYMTSELISSKEAGKERIIHAILGLLLALGAFALLNTINPNILNTDLKSLVDVKVEVKFQEDRNETFTPYVGALPTGALPSCSEGVERSSVNNGFVACKNIINNLDTMLTNAKSAGFDISGGGFRTSDEQTNLRIQNCNGNKTDINAPCSPPTAVPGQSLHENGLAFDLKCNGQQVSAGSPCFTWLQNNAVNYQLYNLPGEPWHWSVNGH